MLIRSQDKKYLIEMNKIIIQASGTEVICYDTSCIADEGYVCLGKYESEAKAMKVLDMIQEAYANFEASKIVSTGLAGATYAGSYDTPESVAGGIKVLKEYIEMIRESAVFQMPEDGSVEA